MPDPRDLLDLSSTSAGSAQGRPAGAGPGAPQPRGPRKFLSLYFACAHAYGRAHPTPDGQCYRGRCPKCAKTIDFPIGEGGTSRRMFEVRCD